MANISPKVDATPNEVFAILKDVEIIFAPHIKPNIKRLIRDGDYERPEIEFGLANLRDGDQIMEMGTGAGIVGSVFLKNVKNLTLQSFEANPDLIPHIRDLYAHNGVSNTATVNNNIVVSGDNAPESMYFDVRENFLGSLLSEKSTDPGARTVAIPTKNYAKITDEYLHNVVVMDIEGGELDFLADADLSNVQLVMLELHPKVYGRRGRQQVIAHLTRQGFLIDDTTSLGEVASFKKPAQMKLAPDYTKIGTGQTPRQTYDIDPHQSLSDRTVTIEKAVLAKTPRSEGFRIAATVFDSDKNPRPEAICWINHTQTATLPRTFSARTTDQTSGWHLAFWWALRTKFQAFFNRNLIASFGP